MLNIIIVRVVLVSFIVNDKQLSNLAT